MIKNRCQIPIDKAVMRIGYCNIILCTPTGKMTSGEKKALLGGVISQYSRISSGREKGEGVSSNNISINQMGIC